MKQFLWFVLLAFVAVVWCTPPAHAGTFKTITIDDVYTDWVGVPVADSDPVDNTAGPDIGDTQIANDNDHLYIRNTFHNSLSLGTFVSIDVDGNSATGFDIFTLGLIGAEAGWQNDFAFAQDTGVFNSGTLSGDYFGGGHALLSPFANAGSRELAISLDALITAGASPVFPDSTITLLVWTDLGAGADGLLGTGDEYDVSGVIQYTLAVPEPATVTSLLFALATLGIVTRRRRR
jgi:PEP-CTERM motif